MRPIAAASATLGLASLVLAVGLASAADAQMDRYGGESSAVAYAPQASPPTVYGAPVYAPAAYGTGPAGPASSAPGSYAPSSYAPGLAPLRARLSWAGKADAAAAMPQAQPSYRGYAPPPLAANGLYPAYGTTISAVPAYAPARYTPVQGPPRQPLQNQLGGYPPAPTSIYGPAPQATGQSAYPAPPAPRPQRTADASGGARFYSVHRQYGLQPDPIPLPPQFFGPTADLSTPPEPDPRRTVTVNGKTQVVNTPVAADQ